MRTDIQVDDRVFRRQLQEFADLTRRSSGEVLKEETRFFIETVIKTLWPKTRKQGRDAVQKGMDRTVSVLKATDFESPSIIDAIKRKNYGRLEEMVKNWPNRKGWRVKPFTPELHTRARTRGGRGRVIKYQKVMTPDFQKVNQWTKRKKGNVGILKASFIPAMIGITGTTGRVPGWVVNQGKRFGTYTDATDRADMPFVEIVNMAHGSAEKAVVGAVRFSMGLRARALTTKLRNHMRDNRLTSGLI